MRHRRCPLWRLEGRTDYPYQEIRDVLRTHRKIRDYRTAAYYVAVRKIAHSKMEMGCAGAKIGPSHKGHSVN
jgi:hypothetical protein